MLIFIILLLFWFICSGQFSTFFVISALTSVFLVSFINKKLFSAHYTKITYLVSIPYVIKLLRDMFVSSLRVSKIIWFDLEKVKPCCRFIDTESLDVKDQVIQANSITLTPGTMSLHLKGNKILVHAINIEMFEGNGDKDT